MIDNHSEQGGDFMKKRLIIIGIMNSIPKKSTRKEKARCRKTENFSTTARNAVVMTGMFFIPTVQRATAVYAKKGNGMSMDILILPF